MKGSKNSKNLSKNKQGRALLIGALLAARPSSIDQRPSDPACSSASDLRTGIYSSEQAGTPSAARTESVCLLLARERAGRPDSALALRSHGADRISARAKISWPATPSQRLRRLYFPAPRGAQGAPRKWSQSWDISGLITGFCAWRCCFCEV